MVLFLPVAYVELNMPRLTLEKRRQIVDFVKDGHTYSSISRRVPCSLDTVRRWAPLAVLEGLSDLDLKDQPRPGANPRFDINTAYTAKRMATRGGTTRSIAAKMHSKGGVRISHTSVAKLLKWGRKPLAWLPITHVRRLSMDNKKARRTFCKHMLGSTMQYFDNWIFIDAKDLYLYRSKGGRLRHAWQQVGAKKPSLLGQAIGQPWVFRFYGAVGLNFKSTLVFVPPSPDASSRARKSKETFQSSHFVAVMQQLCNQVDKHFQGKAMFVMDHAKQHTSKVTREALHDAGVQLVPDYPAQSWDLNIIENIWGVLDGYLTGKVAKTGMGWRRVIERAWQKVSLKTINSLHKGIKGRLMAVAEAEGEWVKHHK